MGLPGHRRTSAEEKQRAYHTRVKKRALSSCPQCGKARRPHRMCAFCGTYRGRTIVRQRQQTTVKKTANV